MLAQRLITWFTAAIAALAVGVPFASAGSGIVDDYFRDGQRSMQATLAAPNRLVDVYRLDGQRVTAPTNRIVDDYFRDGAKLTPAGKYGPLDPWAYKLIHQSVSRSAAASAPASAPNGFDWGAAGIGAAIAFVTMLLGLGVTRLIPRRSRERLA